jgi:hypothetical protein
MSTALRVYNEIIIIEDYVDIKRDNRFSDLTKANIIVDLTEPLKQLKQDIKDKMIDVAIAVQPALAQPANVLPEIKHQARLTCLNYIIGKDLTNTIKVNLTAIDKVFPYKASMKRLLKNVLHIESFLSNNIPAFSGAIMDIKTIYEKDMVDMYRYNTTTKKVDKPKFRFIIPEIKFSVFLPMYLEIKSFVDNFTDNFNSKYNMTKVVKEIQDKVSQISGNILLNRLNITDPISIDSDKRSITFIGKVGGALDTETLPEEIDYNNINQVISKLLTYTLKYNTFFENPRKLLNIYYYFYNDIDFNNYLITLLDKIITYKEEDVPVLASTPVVAETTSSAGQPPVTNRGVSALQNVVRDVVDRTINTSLQSRQSPGRPSP